MFAEREPDRYDMHSAISTRRWCACSRRSATTWVSRRGTGQYLSNAAGARYLDLLSGFGVFAIGRNHPAVRDALKQVLDATCRTSCRWTCRCWRASWPSACWRYCRAWTGCSSPIRLGGGGERDQVRARRDRPRQDRLSAATASTGSPMARCRSTAARCSERASSRCCRIACGAVQRPRRRWSARCARNDRRLLRRADPGQGREHARRRLSAAARRAVPQARHAVHRRRDPDRHGPHRQVPRRSSIGASIPTWCCCRSRSPAATCRSARC